MQRTFLPTWVQLAIGEHSSVQILLCGVAEDFVFAHYAGVGVCNGVEVFVGGVFVAEDFVVHS